MQYDIRWLTYEDLPNVVSLSEIVYSHEKPTYPSNLRPNKNIIKLFLTPIEYLGSDQRSILGVFDESNKLIMAIGIRKLLSIPAWTIAWLLSDIRNITFQTAMESGINFICSEMEKINYKEFFSIFPTEKQKYYKRIMSFLRKNYWTFVEVRIPAGQKTPHSLYWEIMGYQLYQYEVNIKRYILKRDPDE